MADRRDQRAADRAKRRSERRPQAPEEETSAGETEDSDSPLTRAARTAAAAAAAGAAVGAARALVTRPSHDDDGPEADPMQEASDAPTRVDQQPEPEDAVDEEREPDEATPASTPRRPEPAPRRGRQAGDMRQAAAQAREALRELHGRDAESSSSLSRTDDGWTVTLEVVEVERVPDSTDVLASYAVELDDDGNVLAYERLRRYYRAQSDSE